MCVYMYKYRLVDIKIDTNSTVGDPRNDHRRQTRKGVGQ